MVGLASLPTPWAVSCHKDDNEDFQKQLRLLLDWVPQTNQPTHPLPHNRPKYLAHVASRQHYNNMFSYSYSFCECPRIFLKKVLFLVHFYIFPFFAVSFLISVQMPRRKFFFFFSFWALLVHPLWNAPFFTLSSNSNGFKQFQIHASWMDIAVLLLPFPLPLLLPLLEEGHIGKQTTEDIPRDRHKDSDPHKWTAKKPNWKTDKNTPYSTLQS